MPANECRGTVAKAHDERDRSLREKREETEQDPDYIDGDNVNVDGEEELMQQDQDDRAKVGALDDEALEVALVAALQAVRSRHAYCVYCGERYADAAALAAQCPGVFRLDHN